MAASAKLAALFYEIRGDVEGLPGDLKKAEGHFGKLTKYIKEHPLATMGALGGAIVAVGVAATKMAAELEKSFNVIERRVPGAQAKMDELKATIREMSLAGSGRSQGELASTAAAISPGVASIEELEERLQAVVRAADASGESIDGIVSGLDQTLDLFGKSSADSEAVLQRIYAVTRGKMPLADMFEAMKGAAPLVREFGLDMDTVTAAVGALMEQGMKSKAAVSEIGKLAEHGKAGTEQIKLLAASMDVAATSSTEYEASIRTARASSEALWATAKNNLSAVMIDLGQTLIPKVTAALKALDGAVATLNGTIRELETERLITQVSVVGRNLKGLNDFTREELREGVNNLVVAYRDGFVDLNKLTEAQLSGMRAGVASVSGMTGVTAEQTTRYRTLIDAIDKAWTKVINTQKTVAKEAATATGAVGKTSDQLKADEDARAAALKKGTDLYQESQKEIAAFAEQMAKDTVDANVKALQPWLDVMAEIDKALEDLKSKGIGSLDTTAIREANRAGVSEGSPIIGRASMSEADKKALDDEYARDKRTAELQERYNQILEEGALALEAGATNLALALFEGRDAIDLALEDLAASLKSVIVALASAVNPIFGAVASIVTSLKHNVIERAKAFQQYAHDTMSNPDAAGAHSLKEAEEMIKAAEAGRAAAEAFREVARVLAEYGNRVKNEVMGIQGRIARAGANGDPDKLREVERADELAAAHSALARAMLEELYAVEDANREAEDAATRAQRHQDVLDEIARLEDDGAAQEQERAARMTAAMSDEERAALTLLFALQDAAQAMDEAAAAADALANASRILGSLQSQLARENGDDQGADHMDLDQWYADQKEAIEKMNIPQDKKDEMLATLDELYKKKSENIDNRYEGGDNPGTSTGGYSPGPSAGEGGPGTSSTGGRLTLVGEDRIVALLTSEVGWSAQIAGYLQALSAPMASISAPIAQGGTFGSSRGMVVHITQKLYFGANPEARQVATVVTEEMARELSRWFAKFDRQQRRHDGTDGDAS